ncbi:MAG: hypothetical protein FWD57_04880 [Polyangiaceae bacterium]|nr:hypothetical protein [Polyangiaceae bacterium]
MKQPLGQPQKSLSACPLISLPIPPNATRLPMDASLTGCWVSGTAFSTERCIPNGMPQKGDGILR